MAHVENIATRVRHCSSVDAPVDIAYQTFGNATDPAFVLFCGLNGQLLQWPMDFVEALVARGFFVIRFDHRDVGHSTKFDDAPCPTLVTHELPWWLQWRKTKEPYTLDDMALDAWALVDRLAGEGAKAHLFGTSMGGMVAQCAALLKPERVLSLISVMSTTGARDLNDTPMWVKLNFLKKPKSDSLEDRLDFRVEMHRKVFSYGVDMDEDEIRHIGELITRRSTYIAGMKRHVAAIKRAPPRDDAFRSLGSRAPPTLVLHGQQDHLFDVEHAERTAEVIHGARLVLIDGMGHHLSNKRIRQRLLEEIEQFHSSLRDGAAA